MNAPQVEELLLQSLEHEKGGVQVYETALQCVLNADLKEEWEKYLEETNNHVRFLTDACEAIGLDPNRESPGRTVVRKVGASLVAAMGEALSSGPPEAAQLVACECVVPRGDERPSGLGADRQVCGKARRAKGQGAEECL